MPDQRLGEKLVLLYEGTETPASLEKLCRHVLPRYWVPRSYYSVFQIPLTETGKKARLSARDMALRLARRKQA